MTELFDAQGKKIDPKSGDDPNPGADPKSGNEPKPGADPKNTDPKDPPGPVPEEASADSALQPDITAEGDHVDDDVESCIKCDPQVIYYFHGYFLYFYNGQAKRWDFSTRKIYPR